MIDNRGSGAGGSPEAEKQYKPEERYLEKEDKKTDKEQSEDVQVGGEGEVIEDLEEASHRQSSGVDQAMNKGNQWQQERERAEYREAENAYRAEREREKSRERDAFVNDQEPGYSGKGGAETSRGRRKSRRRGRERAKHTSKINHLNAINRRRQGLERGSMGVARAVPAIGVANAVSRRAAAVSPMAARAPDVKRSKVDELTGKAGGAVTKDISAREREKNSTKEMVRASQDRVTVVQPVQARATVVLRSETVHRGVKVVTETTVPAASHVVRGDVAQHAAVPRGVSDSVARAMSGAIGSVVRMAATIMPAPVVVVTVSREIVPSPAVAAPAAQQPQGGRPSASTQPEQGQRGGESPSQGGGMATSVAMQPQFVISVRVSGGLVSEIAIRAVPSHAPERQANDRGGISTQLQSGSATAAGQGQGHTVGGGHSI